MWLRGCLQVIAKYDFVASLPPGHAAIAFPVAREAEKQYKVMRKYVQEKEANYDQDTKTAHPISLVYRNDGCAYVICKNPNRKWIYSHRGQRNLPCFMCFAFSVCDFCSGNRRSFIGHFNGIRYLYNPDNYNQNVDYIAVHPEKRYNSYN